MKILQKLAVVFIALFAISGCQYKGTCGKSYENVDYSTVHFGYDQDHLTTQAMMKLDKQIHYLMHHEAASRGQDQVLIAGHTDERGSSEYNMGLGARRANAVKQYLVGKGIDASKIETVSYGKARPVDPGHNEAAWAKNRRAVTMVK